MNNSLSKEIVDAAFKVHTTLGPDLMEHEIQKRGLDVKNEVFMPVAYDSKVFDIGYRLDLLVESEIIIELKAVNQLLPVHKAQLITYLKIARKSSGLLINFNSALIKDGIVRVAN